MLDQLLRRFEPFAPLDWASLATLARHARLVRIAAGRYLSADAARRGRYYLHRGVVRAIDSAGVSTEIDARSARARLPLLGDHDGCRVETLSACTLLWVDSAPIAFLLEAHPLEHYAVKYIGPGESPTSWQERFLERGLDALAPRQLKALFDALRPRTVAAGEAVFEEGEPGREFYVVASGDAVVLRGGRVVARLTAGDAFGEDALISGRDRNAAVRMQSDGRLMVLPERAFHAQLARPLVRWSDGSEPDAVSFRVDASIDPRLALAAPSARDPHLFVGGDRRLRAWWTFVAARRGITAAALADAGQAGTVRPDAQVRKLSMASERSTDKG